MANLAPACCCTITCTEFAACAPGPCIRIPLMVFRREQREENSACTLTIRELDFIIRDATFEWDAFSRCYLLQCAEVEAHYREQLWATFSPWGGTKTFDIAEGDCCPDCLQCCKVSDTTFDVPPSPLANGISICCVQPCGLDSKPLFRMVFDRFLNGDLEQQYSAGAPGADCCPALVTDGVVPSFLFFRFDVWTPVTCDITKWFQCRSVDWRIGDVLPGGDTNGWGWSSGRITGGPIPAPPAPPGAPKINLICDGAYEHERPGCSYGPGGDPDQTILDCAQLGHGTLGTTFDVTSCRPTDAYPDTIWDPSANLELDYWFECIDSSSSDPCPIKVCGNGVTTGPNPACDPVYLNTDGLAAWAERRDISKSLFQQAVVDSCVTECPPEGEP